MTCIVAVKGNDRIVIGGDSAGVAGLDVVLRKDPKVFENGPFTIGFTSSFRMGQTLMDLVVPKQKKNQNDFQFMRTTFVTAVQKHFEGTGYLKKENEQKSGGCFLVIYRGEIYKIEEDFQVEIRTDPFNACGCGEDFANGALEAIHKSGSTGWSPEWAVRTALEVAAKFSGGVRAPWTILSIPLVKETK